MIKSFLYTTEGRPKGSVPSPLEGGSSCEAYSNICLSGQTALLCLIFILIFSGAFFSQNAEAARVYLDITSAQFQKIPVAVPFFEDKDKKGVISESGRELSGSFGSFLTFHGFIKIISPDKYGGEMTADWQNIGADFVVKGQYSRSTSGVVLELRLVDIQEGRMVLGRRYRGAWNKRKTMLQKFCDEMILSLTGESGVSQSKIAFVAETGGHKEIFVADILGEDIRQVTHHRSLAVSPRFSPDGTQLLYTSYHRGNPNLYITDLSQSIVTRPLSSRKGLNMSPAWSPNGKRLAVTLSVDGNPDLYIINTKGKILSKLTRDSGINVSPTWSPDGKFLSFVSDRTGSPQIYVMRLKDRSVRRISYQGGYNTSPNWSPKGDRIAYSGRYEGNYHIFTTTPEGRETRQLTSSWGDYESPSWSPDGRQIVFSRRRRDKVQLCAVFQNGAGLRPLFKFPGNQSFPQWSPRLKK